MVDAVQNFLHSFEELSRDDQQVAIREIMIRCKNQGLTEVEEDYGAISDDAMLEIADAGFQRLDEEEAIGQTKAR